MCTVYCVRWIRMIEYLCVDFFEEVNGELELFLLWTADTFEEEFITFNLNFGVTTILDANR